MKRALKIEITIMKIILSTLFIVSFVSLNAQQVYDFRLEDIHGNQQSYTALKGDKITLIDFWATWCKPCVNSIPKLITLSETYDSTQVAFIGISIDSPRNLAKVKPFVETLGISYPILLDVNQEIYRDLNIAVIPTLIMIDSKNEIIYIHEGFLPGDEELIKEEIDNYLHHD